ncbi:Cytochrome P450 82A4, partial [Bienertia sinuspersici]
TLLLGGSVTIESERNIATIPPGPLIAPREFIEDCTIGNYHVKSGTKLIVNVSKISRDPRVDVKGQHFELIPFGVGRRTRPGISFGLHVVHLSLASFLHAFKFPTDQNARINLSKSLGLTSMKAKPLQVLVDPSLSSKAYAS